MVIDLAAPKRNPATARHTPEQLQQAAVARAVDAARTYDRHLDAQPRAGFAGGLFAFEFRFLIDIAWPERCVFVRGRVLDVAVHPDGTAMDHAAHARGRGGFDKLPDGG